MIGKIKFGFAVSNEDFKIFVGKDFDHIDLEILDKNKLSPHSRYKHAKIIKDKNGMLKKLTE